MSRLCPVYVIDDDSSVRNSLRMLLSSSGLNVSVFPTGDDFLEQHHQLQPGVMVLDLRMPGTDGMIVLKLRRPEFPVIIYSASVSHQDRQSALENGAFDVLDKGCSSLSLLERVHQAAALVPPSGVC